MNSSIEAIGASLESLEQYYEVITHNLANANTAGYKRLVMSMVESPGQEDPSGTSPEAMTAQVAVDFTQGHLVQTRRSLDLALEGKNSFFVIETPEGLLYTRNGVFRTNAEGQLVDCAGQSVSGGGGPIIIPSSVSLASVSVAQDGQISAGGEAIGKLSIVEFDDPNQLTQVGQNCFRAPEGVVSSPAAEIAIYQGFQEASNVSAVEELVDLIMVTRMYEANLKSTHALDEQAGNLLDVAAG